VLQFCVTVWNRVLYVVRDYWPSQVQAHVGNRPELPTIITVIIMNATELMTTADWSTSTGLDVAQRSLQRSQVSLSLMTII